MKGAGSVGQGFSPDRIPYISQPESTGALAPEVCLSPVEPGNRPFPAASLEDQSASPADSTELTEDLVEPVPEQPEHSTLFQSFTQPEIHPPARIPHLGHLCILAVLAFSGLLGASLLTRSALYFHLFGISTVKQALTDIHYTLGSMAALYLLTLLFSLLVFPLFWHKTFFAGVQWRGATALRLRGGLFSAAFVCFVLAMIDGFLLPGPDDTPIDKIIRAPGAPWLLFAFGVTLAPFFEEILFRGFLLPALSTAADWLAEQASGQPAPPLDANGHPQWSIPAMVVASVFTSIPFALVHADQTGHALGPFLLLVCVSLVLCWTRLVARSLAASVLVHACYNFMLFSLMLFGTDGFKHLEKM